MRPARSAAVACALFAAGRAMADEGYEAWGPSPAFEPRALPTVAQSTAGLAPEHDSAPNGDRRTSFAVADLVGVTAPFAEVLVQPGGLEAVASATGSWRVPRVAMAEGANAFTILFSDAETSKSVGLAVQCLAPHEEGDVVLQWNAEALDAFRRDRTAPPRVARHLAIMHLAMWQAAQGLASDAERAAAASSAAAAYLDVEFPESGTEVEARLGQSLSRIAESAGKDAAVRQGSGLAFAWRDHRAQDGSALVVEYHPQDAPGRWRRTPPRYLEPLLPGWGAVTPFLPGSVDELLPPPPPALHTAAYAAALAEVRALGAKAGHSRTPEQTEIALFWADQSGTATPPGHWNRIAATACMAAPGTLEQNLELFARLNAALADASIACWATKYRDDLWRPVSAIREADFDGIPETVGDPVWESLITTPPFPEYTSGHSTFSGAAAVVLAARFGEDFAFEDNSDGLMLQFGVPEVRRAFASFDHAASEASVSRIYGGIHFRPACELGIESGRAVGLRALAADPPMIPPTGLLLY